MAWQCIQWTFYDWSVQVYMGSQWVTAQQDTKLSIVSSWNYVATGWLPDVTIQEMNFLYKLRCTWDTVKGAYRNVIGQHQNRYYGHWQEQNEMRHSVIHWRVLHLLTIKMNLTRYMKVIPDMGKKSICNQLSNAHAQYYSLTEILAVMKTNVFTKLGSSSNSTY